VPKWDLLFSALQNFIGETDAVINTSVESRVTFHHSACLFRSWFTAAFRNSCVPSLAGSDFVTGTTSRVDGGYAIR